MLQAPASMTLDIMNYKRKYCVEMQLLFVLNLILTSHSLLKLIKAAETSSESFSKSASFEIQLEEPKLAPELPTSTDDRSVSVSVSDKTKPVNELIRSVASLYANNFKEMLDDLLKDSQTNDAQLQAIFTPVIEVIQEKQGSENNALHNKMKEVFVSFQSFSIKIIFSHVCIAYSGN